MSSTSTTRQRIRGLDGLRAVAALVVLGFHLLPTSVASGFVGVDVFFVISGFLITALFLREKERDGRVSLGRFWARRIRRLLPAVVVATFGSIALARLVGGDALVQLPWQTFGSLTGTYNWLEISNGSSYFNQQSPLLLTNMWSLAVEQQFYIVWPVVLLIILAFVPRHYGPMVTAGLAGVSALLHVMYVVHGGDVTRAYVGTDSHSFGLMCGATLALMFPQVMRGRMVALPHKQSRIWSGLAWAGLAGVLAIAVFVPDGRLMYPWGMLAVSLLTMLVVRGMFPDVDSFASRLLVGILELRPVAWLGERSYGIYLWHWPLWVLAFYQFGWKQAPTALVVTACSIVLADLSYRFIETPIRTKGFVIWTYELLERMTPRTAAAPAAALIAVFALFTSALVGSPARSSAEEYVAAGAEALDRAQATPAASTAPSVVPTESSTPLPAPSTAAPAPTTAPAPAAEPSADVTAAPRVPVDGGSVTIIGDSVTLASTPALQEVLPNVFINAEVSRSIQALPSLIGAIHSQGNLRDYVVVALATNATIRDKDVDAMFAALGPNRRVVMVTGYGPESDSWIWQANAEIAEIAAAYPDRVRVADWASIAAAHPELLAGDRVHPGKAGAALYAQAVADALNSF